LAIPGLKWHARRIIETERLREITLIAGVLEDIGPLPAAGRICAVVTVQNGIAKGFFSLPEFESGSQFRSESSNAGALVVGDTCAVIALPARVPAKSRTSSFTIVRQLNINLSGQIVL
jgi:hypothetical protein